MPKRKQRGITPEIAQEIRKGKGLEETKLQKHRVNKNMSQDDLAEVSKVKKRTIQSYEQGTAPIEAARLDTLCSLSESLDCRIENLIEDKDLLKRYKKVK